MQVAQTGGDVFLASPVQRPREQVEGQIRQAILSGGIPVGSKLPSEHALASSFNVSRATVREALRPLIEGGLLAKGPSATSGLYIQRVDHLTLSEIVAERLANTIDLGSVKPEEVAGFRDLLEVPSAQLAATRRTRAHLDSLRGIIDQEIATTFDAPNVPVLNARFHAEVANASGNRVLAAFVAALHRAAHPLAFVNTDAELGRVAVSHHIQIHKAIEARDPEAASTAMQSHLDYLRTHANSSGANAAKVVRLPQLLS